MKIFAAITFIVGVIVFAFYWKAAKNEVFNLCGNFKPGMNKADVIRQLDTANLSSYISRQDESGVEIEFSSDINFSINKCVIKTDSTGKVTQALFI